MDEMKGMRIKTLTVGMLRANCYILSDNETGRAFLIDPGGEYKKILSEVKNENVSVVSILCTHGHIDHIGSAGKISQNLGVPIFISFKDSKNFSASLLGVLHGNAFSKPRNLEFSGEREELQLGANSVRVIQTPGHTPGSLSFLAGNNLFCGDLIFKGSIGRTDFPGGSLDDLMSSLRDKVFVLPDETVIFPGHGPSTSVGEEKRSNPFIVSIARGARGGNKI
ncbi:MAG: MBL fold metallo-hydrolase [Actinomycetota bacterium]|nr:MBL fold metallo-hydrolase [Actinomycetota bacterium]